MRLWDKLAVAALIVLAVLGKYVGGESPGDGAMPRRPDPGQFAPPPPTQPTPPGARLDPVAPGDPAILVPVGAKQASSSGTAFSIDRGGIWIES